MRLAVERKLGEIAGVTANVNFATRIASVIAPGQMPLAAPAPAPEEVASCQG